MRAVVATLVLLFALSSAKVLYNRQHVPGDWVRGERASPLAETTFMIALKQQNLDKLDATFWAVSDPKSPSYRQFLTIDEINSIVRPAAADLEAVTAWLNAHGVRQIRDLGDAFECTTIAQFTEELFSTELYEYVHTDGRKIVRTWGEHSVPAEVEGAIEFVEGISGFPIPKMMTKRNLRSNSPDGTEVIVPQSIYSMYGTPASDGSVSNSSQGVIEFENQNYSPQQLQSFAQQMEITIPALESAHIVGNNNAGAPGVEATLDIQYIAAVGVGVENWFWLEGGGVWLYGFANHFLNTQDVPLVISISYGWNEEQQCQNGIGGQECQQLGVDSKQYVTRVNTEFQKVGLRGVSIFAASGDSGANGRTDEGCSETHLNPSFPAASPYLTAVGATQVNSPQNNLNNAPSLCSSGSYSCVSAGTEAAVSYAVSHFASGGGFSNVASMPSYQKDAVSAYLSGGTALPPTGYYNAQGRGFPDVGAFGHNVLVDSGFLEPVGGTSAASPIFAGVVALLNDVAIKADGKPLGFMNPLLYQMFASDPTIFNDVVTGDNKCTESGCGFGNCKGFECAAGWDPVTGLGTPNYGKMKAYVQQHVL